MAQTIVVPLLDSVFSTRAIPVLTALADRCEADLHLLDLRPAQPAERETSGPRLMQEARVRSIREAYCAHIAAQCLTARRLVERGTRFVQIYSGGMENQLSWDCHLDLIGNHTGFARETDQPFAALLVDLDQRGMLKDTLVICAGEFGRLPISQKGAKPGRDHNPHAFTIWMAGAGVKGGFHYGETDEIGHKAVVNKVSVHDLHATILHALGLDHEKLTYPFQGLDARLTGVEPCHVVKEIFA